MNDFREALEAYLAGGVDLAAVRSALHLSLAREPKLSAAHRAHIEALYRSDRLSGEAYLALAEVIGAGAEGDRTRFRARGSAKSPPAAHTPTPGPAGAPAPESGTPGGDKTLFRAPKSTGHDAGESSATAGADKTRFRVRSQASGVQPHPSEPSADATRLRARATQGASSAAAPSQAAVPAGDPSWSPTTGSSTGSLASGSALTGPSTWSDPKRWSGGASVPLAVGSVVKERFVLEEEIGRGGMGIVFKARDLRMEEAQDRNPYIAIKILNDEFKRHPESLKALQREFRKAQSLAHPNVVTVGDFDRDGANVFMTMELLEGEPLDRIIKRARNSGLEKAEALRIIRDICRAMAYAHDRNIVHSDFKPANAFLTRDGVVKVFDFGIARAAKQGDRVGGTVTVFDAGSLGALTPAYASCEMIEGAEPDVRDDVYAIACVAYELLTGRHPFDRKSAAQARAAKLVPARPAGLDRGQWRALKRGLAFRRGERSATPIELLNGLLPPKRSPAVYVGAAVAILAIVAAAVVVVPREIQRYDQQRWITALRSGTAARIAAVLPAIAQLSATNRDAIFANRNARDDLIRYYDGKIRTAESRGDYFIASGFANRLLKYLPDYADAQRVSQQVKSDANDALERQSNRFDADLKAGRLIAAQGADNIQTVLEAVRRINPREALLHDPRLAGAFASQARLAMEHSNEALAQQLLSSGLKIAPSNPNLLNLNDRVRSTLLSQETAVRVAHDEHSLTALLDTHPDLTALDSLREDVTQLRADAPGSAVLGRVQHYAQGKIERELSGLARQQKLSQAQSILDEYADLVSPAFGERQRDRLNTARLTEEHKTADIAQMRRERVTVLKSRLAALVARGPGENPASWNAQLSAVQGALSVYVAPSNPYFAQVRSEAAAAYVKTADQLRQAGRLVATGQMLKYAQAYGLPAAQLAREKRLLAASHAQLAAAAETQEQQAQTEALEQKLLVQAGANTVNGALASLTALRARLPASDPFLTTKAPAAIGRSYLRLAASAAFDGRFEEAENLVKKGHTAAPSFTPLGAAANRYATYAVLDRDMTSVNAANVGQIRAQIDREARLSPQEGQALEHGLARSLAVRIGEAPDAEAADRLRALGRKLFPKNAQFAKPALAAQVPVTQHATAAAGSPTPAISKASKPSQAAAAPLVARVSTPTQSGTGSASVPATQPLALHNCANPELVGAGGNPRASCWDAVAGGRGPVLVVVPAPPGGHPFAIGRYDVSNADFARYCHATHKCATDGASPALPVTSISIAQAEGYMRWLSSESGAVYRLPSAAEYIYAADAGTSAGEIPGANCKKPGFAPTLLPVNSGTPNAWGLYDVAGNVRQWVRSGSQLQVRGGDYRAAFSQCKPTTARAQSGTPSAVTGFRVVRVIK